MEPCPYCKRPCNNLQTHLSYALIDKDRKYREKHKQMIEIGTEDG